MRYSDINEEVFKSKVDDALKTVERILEVQRNPRLAGDVEHVYDDKYGLANMLTNTFIIAQMNVLERLGLTAEVLKSINKSKATTLRFQISDSCTFLKEQTVDVEMDRTFEQGEEITTTGSFFGTTKKSTINKIVNHIKEYHWKVDVHWEISVYEGTDMDGKKVLRNRSSSMVVVVQTNKRPPLPEHRSHEPIDVSLTWLLKQINTETFTAQFIIDTQDSDTKTPSRNQAVDNTMTFLSDFEYWNRDVRHKLTSVLENDIIGKHNPAGPQADVTQRNVLSSLSSASVFVPVQPLMEERKVGGDVTRTSDVDISIQPMSMLSLASDPQDTTGSSFPSPILSNIDMRKLLDEQVRCLEECVENLQKMFPSHQLNKLVSVAEATLVVLTEHSISLSSRYRESIAYIEKMLENQLISAIGKKVDSSDLDQFVRFHNAKIFVPPPHPFCHSIRRPDHYPDGILTIESKNGDGKFEPIDTFVQESSSSSPLRVPLNAATTVQLTGKKYLHGWMRHCFRQSHKDFQLTGRARQFSSFMLIIGTMVAGDKLEPKDAIILQNKDEVIIPLLLNELPSAKEFKDAIKSLSPEQQRFAKAFRAMQLESSVFGVCVIQIKPQLEELLGLPPDALTKEMKLTQDLMELFVEYQVPSDLLSYDGEGEDVSMGDKVGNVRGHVKAVMDVVNAAKSEQLEEQLMKADMAVESYATERPEMAFFGAGAEVKRDVTLRGRPARVLKMQAAPMYRMAAATSHAAPQTCIPQSLSVQKQMKIPRQVPEFQSKTTSAGNEVREQKVPDTRHQKIEVFDKHSLEPKSGGEAVVDFTMIPQLLDSSIEKYDADNSLRSTIIKTSNTWTRNRQENLLTKITSSTLPANVIKSEKDKAFDLLDALSRSGSLPISCSELHVIVCVTHRFEKDVMDTIIQDNINPIEKLEMSTLLVASAIHRVPASALVSEKAELLRLKAAFPALMESTIDDNPVESE